VSDGTPGQWFHGESGVLRKFRQQNVVGTASHDQMHPARLEIHRNALAEHRGKRRDKCLATRLNGLYTGIFFLGGAIGSIFAGIASIRRDGRLCV
jgi:hypothetical protein